MTTSVAIYDEEPRLSGLTGLNTSFAGEMLNTFDTTVWTLGFGIRHFPI
ncbi:MAG: hypothetical protein OXG05_00565 [Gammaproteobacteria bacterium]|nr:hypothetical protein [Gammaproteobacteria bacterium]